MTDKERIAELETRLVKAYELLEKVSGATAEAVKSFKTDQDIIKEMVFGLWEREGVESIDAWMDAIDRFREKGR